MRHTEDLEQIIFAAHALTRIAARETGNETPAAQWRALSALAAGGPLRVGELARESRTTQPGMTRLVGLLTDDGLVTKGADPDDSRAAVVEITEHGRDALAEWKRELGAALAPRFEGLDDDDWAMLARAARILSDRTRLEPAR